MGETRALKGLFTAAMLDKLLKAEEFPTNAHLSLDGDPRSEGEVSCCSVDHGPADLVKRV